MKADTQTIDILLLGSGGREHALAAKLAASPRAGKLYIAPGNGGTASCGENVVLDDCDPAAVAAFAQSHGCGLVVIGPEAPLVAGVADAVRAAGIPCFGPGAEGAQMEGSKLFSKQLMERAGIPTAAYGSFTDEASALAYVREQGAPLVVKADGLAAGKGVIVATELEQAEDAVRECFGGTFGDAGNTVVIEEMLTGPECSLLAFVTNGHAFCITTLVSVPYLCHCSTSGIISRRANPSESLIPMFSYTPSISTLAATSPALMVTVLERIL